MFKYFKNNNFYKVKFQKHIMKHLNHYFVSHFLESTKSNGETKKQTHTNKNQQNEIKAMVLGPALWYSMR